MARIRQIKPEFWSSPSTAQASAVARLLFIAMWNWADDSGHGTGNLKELEGFAFPHDDVAELSGGKCRNFRDCVTEVCGSFGVTFYTVRGRVYYEIPSWQNHQRNERLAQGKHPLPEEGEILDMAGDGAPKPVESRKASEAPQQDVGASVSVSGVQGVRVSEVQGHRGTAAHVIPANFTLTLERKQWAEENTPAVNADRETEGFVDYWRGEQGKKKNWETTWRNWMRRKQTEAEGKGWKPADTYDPKNWMNQL